MITNVLIWMTTATNRCVLNVIIAALNLMIENQNKSAILDALIAGILTRPRESYQGTAKMSSGKFRSIINRIEMTGLRMMVDPAENPFIERIRYYGNYWIFPGINYAPAHTLQGFLNVLCLRGIQFNDDFAHKAHQLLISINTTISFYAFHNFKYAVTQL